MEITDHDARPANRRSPPGWRARTTSAAGGIVAVLSLALLAAGVSGGALPAAAAAASSGCPAPAPSGASHLEDPSVNFTYVLESPSAPLAKPAATVGLTQTIYWTPEPDAYWANSGVTGQGWGGFAYIVNITNLTTCQVKSVDVPGGTAASQFTVTASDFPAAANAIDGTSFAFRLSTTETGCGPGDAIDICDGVQSQQSATIYSDQSAAVVSLQDATAPVARSLTLAGGAVYTNQLTVPVRLEAVDPPPAPGSGVRFGVAGEYSASGVGFMQFSSSASFACMRLYESCAAAYTPTTTVTLAPGPDGPRVVCARVFDKAQAPTYGAPAPSAALAPVRQPTVAQPPGNVSAPVCSTIVLDTTAPTLVVSYGSSAEVGQKVSFDGTASYDPRAGPDPGSGINAASARWTFSDGAVKTGLTCSHHFKTAGTYTVTFSLTDNAGNVATTTRKVVITAAG